MAQNTEESEQSMRDWLSAEDDTPPRIRTLETKMRARIRTLEAKMQVVNEEERKELELPLKELKALVNGLQLVRESKAKLASIFERIEQVE